MPTTVCMPDFDLPTRCMSGFLLRYIAPRVEPVQLFSLMMRRLPFQLSAPLSSVIIGAGHGTKDIFTGQNETIILEVGKYNPREVKGKIIKLISCGCGAELGPDMVKNGAASFSGYTDDYVWVMDSDLASTPWADPIAAVNMMPPINEGNALLDGKTVLEAFNIQLEDYLRNAEVEENELVRSCIEFNHDNAVLLGDRSAKIRTRPPLPLPFRIAPPPPLPPVVGGLL